jgi:hypothetical protein
MADNLPQTGSKRSKSSDSDELPLHQKQTEGKLDKGKKLVVQLLMI